MRYTRGTQSEQARREGVHRSTISRRVKDGKQDLSGTDNERKLHKVNESLMPKPSDESRPE